MRRFKLGELLATRWLWMIVFLTCVLHSALGYGQQPDAAAQQKLQRLYNSIAWERGPTQAKLGALAEIQVPQGYEFTGKAGAAVWNEITENPADAKVLGVLRPTDGEWFLSFSFDPIGYVSDAEKKALDANSILAAMRQSTEQANAERRRQGWTEIQVVDWISAPAFEERSKHLTWSVRGRTSQGAGLANYDTRILGRQGVMSVTLVDDVSRISADIPTVRGLLSDFRFTSGNTYAEWRAGDKTADYGLIGLVAGGVTTLAAKSGWLAKFGKAIYVVIAAILVFLSWIWKSITGHSKKRRAP